MTEWTGWIAFGVIVAVFPASAIAVAWMLRRPPLIDDPAMRSSRDTPPPPPPPPPVPAAVAGYSSVTAWDCGCIAHGAELISPCSTEHDPAYWAALEQREGLTP